MELMDCIWEGKQYCKEKENHFAQLQKSFLETIQKEFSLNNSSEIGKEIGKCENEAKLVFRFKKYFDWKSLSVEYFSEIQKSSELSKALRERANESYKIGNVSKSLRGYNLAIAFAPTGSSELGLAFGNRSALFIQMKEPLFAIRDIDLAFSNNFPKVFSDKLLQRREKCEDLLKTEKEINQRNEEAKEYCEGNFFKLKNPHKNIPNAEDWVDIQVERDRGRKLVAMKDVPADEESDEFGLLIGTLILTDQPSVSVINELLIWDLQHCHYCSKPLLAGIPCEICTFTFYCNETCRMKSCNGNHKYEHNYLSYLHSIYSKITHRELQSLRLIGLFGPKRLLELFKDETKLNPSGQVKGYDSNQIYDCKSYLPIYHLISHKVEDSNEVLENLFKAFVLTHLLKEKSNFFQEIQENSETFQDFITSLIYRHINNIRFNAISISKLKNTSTGEMSFAYATATYPLISLCNHSCDPNAAAVKKFKFLQTSLITLKNLKAGDEIFITYKPLFTHMKTKDRIEYLQNNYNFICSCSACLNNWSIKSIREQMEMELEKGRISISKCKKCVTKNMKKRIDDSKSCHQDCLKIELKRVLAELDRFEMELHKGDDEIKNGNYIKGIELIKPCLVHFTQQEDYDYPSLNSLTQVALELFKRGLLRVVYQAQYFDDTVK